MFLQCFVRTVSNISLSVRACVQLLNHAQLFVTPWTIVHQTPLSMGFPRQEHWSEFPGLPPGDLPDPGIELTSHMSPELTGRFFTTEPPGKALHYLYNCLKLFRDDTLSRFL